MGIKTAEYDEMEELFEAKKKEIGDNAAQISTISSEVETMEAELASDQEFLATLTERCSMKKKEFEKRNMLRAGEEAAIAEVSRSSTATRPLRASARWMPRPRVRPVSSSSRRPRP